MRKLVCVVIVTVLLSLAAIIVSADEAPFANGWELYSSWNGELPDYVHGVWLSDEKMGTVTFGIPEGEEGDTAKTMILDAISDKTSVSFEVIKFSRDELERVKSEVDVYIEKNIGIKESYLDIKRNRVEILVLAERVNDRTTQSIVATIKEKHGDMVYIAYEGDMFKQTIIAVGNGAEEESKFESVRYIIILLSVIIALLASGYMVIIKKRRNLLNSTVTVKKSEMSVGESDSSKTKNDSDAAEDKPSFNASEDDSTVAEGNKELQADEEKSDNEDNE